MRFCLRSAARRTAGAALAVLLAAGADTLAHSQSADSGSTPLPSGLELLHLVPGDQPPLATLDPDNFDQLRVQFNADSAYARVVLMMSPT